LIDRLSADVEQIRQALKHTITMGVRSTTAIVGGIIALSMISAKMTLLMGALLPTVVGVGAMYSSYLRSLTRETRHASAKVRSIHCHPFSLI
jgi:ATP-binding cassette, subfamily B (MDR/TAP), member 8